jgi:hypothetical protein
MRSGRMAGARPDQIDLRYLISPGNEPKPCGGSSAPSADSRAKYQAASRASRGHPNDVAETEELTPEVKTFMCKRWRALTFWRLRPMRPVVICRRDTAPVAALTFRT